MNINGVFAVFLALLVALLLYTPVAARARIDGTISRIFKHQLLGCGMGLPTRKGSYSPRWASTGRDKGEYDQLRHSWDSVLQRDTGYETRDTFEEWRETFNNRP
jgi:hypothetical protein